MKRNKHTSSDKLYQQEKLKQYINNNMSDEEQHLFEKEMLNDPFLEDAAEGLSQTNNKQNIDTVVFELNQKLKNNLQARKDRKQKLRYKQPSFIIISVAVLLLLILMIIMVYIKLKS